jgi:predicted membrane chloride channel (bestrophin family)
MIMTISSCLPFIDRFLRFLSGLHVETFFKVVKFAVYVFFALSLIGSQELEKDPYTFIPIFLILKFIFFFGWLEVAEAIENPFGNDDDDFQICELVSRHIWV